MSVTDELLANNVRYAEGFSGPLPLPPARHVAVVAISQRLLGTEEIILIHHTDCGMLTFTDDEFKKSIQEETGLKPAWAAEAFDDLDTEIRQSIARIQANPFIPKKDAIRGFVFDVATGRLNEVT